MSRLIELIGVLGRINKRRIFRILLNLRIKRMYMFLFRKNNLFIKKKGLD